MTLILIKSSPLILPRLVEFSLIKISYNVARNHAFVYSGRRIPEVQKANAFAVYWILTPFYRKSS